ncbi:hypothetical protein FISHEDRAFT_38708, partial [Fistulina hepatica ATCC 64428]
AIRAFRAIVPEQKDRIHINADLDGLAYIPYMIIGYLPLWYMAYLARRPNTHFLRIMILPIAMLSAVASSCRYYFNSEPNIMLGLNWSTGLLALVGVGRAIRYAIPRKGILKVGEIEPGLFKDGSTREQIVSWAPAWLYDSVELLATGRGLGWEFGEGVYIPPYNKPLERNAFLRATCLEFAKYFFTYDILETFLKLFPGVGSPEGGSMYYSNLAPVPRFLVATCIHSAMGYFVYAMFQLYYSLFALIGVGLCRSDPASWPPLFSSPLFCASMHELWAQGWQQLLHPTFYVWGGYVGEMLFGRLGLLAGTFFASGLYHELSFYTVGRGLDSAPFVFFMLQVPILQLERLWRQVTGKRVGGRAGHLWVLFIMFVVAQPMIDSWLKRGYAGCLMIPAVISPARTLLRWLGYWPQAW